MLTSLDATSLISSHAQGDLKPFETNIALLSKCNPCKNGWQEAMRKSPVFPRPYTPICISYIAEEIGRFEALWSIKSLGFANTPTPMLLDMICYMVKPLIALFPELPEVQQHFKELLVMGGNQSQFTNDQRLHLKAFMKKLDIEIKITPRYRTGFNFRREVFGLLYAICSSAFNDTLHIRALRITAIAAQIARNHGTYRPKEGLMGKDPYPPSKMLEDHIDTVLADLPRATKETST